MREVLPLSEDPAVHNPLSLDLHTALPLLSLSLSCSLPPPLLSPPSPLPLPSLSPLLSH